MKNFLTAVLVAFLLPIGLFSQNMDALRKDYPLLMEKFGNELSEQRADYIFAIDVSGTMYNCKDYVVPALQEFFKSLQVGDYVSIIKFGGEAANDLGSSGKINDQTIQNLISYSEHIYDKPSTQYDRERFFNSTDLENMLQYLATDMQQIDRNPLKFVFIITDFIHDPSASRIGKEQWEAIARRFLTEQSGNDVYVCALQLPGSGRDLERVRSVFPDTFDFRHVNITSNSALSDWFEQRKNSIILDKFKALVKHKIEPCDLSVSASSDIDGNLSLCPSWKPNPVYDCLRLDSALVSDNDFSVKTLLPASIAIPEIEVQAGRLVHNQQSIFHPRFRRIKTNIIVDTSFDIPYISELSRLGIDTPSYQAEAPLDHLVFFYPIPLKVFILICLLILLYIVLVIRAILRNGSNEYRINGHFKIGEGGFDCTERKQCKNKDLVSFGSGGNFLAVDAQPHWRISISVKRFNPFIRPLKRPAYKVRLEEGREFKVGGRKYSRAQIPSIGRYTNIYVGAYTIKWTK